jgi:hypothetical protein
LDSDGCKQALLDGSAAAIADGDISATPLAEPARALPDYCEDRAAATDFGAAAAELSQQTTLKDYANFLQEESCSGFEASLPAREAELDGLKASIATDLADLLEVNWGLATDAGETTADLETYSAEQRAAFDADADFTGTPTGETVEDVPAGYCSEAVYTALQDA